MAGRPTKLTPKVAETIIGAVTAGQYFETACALAGVHKDTAYEWLKISARRDGVPAQSEGPGGIQAVRRRRIVTGGESTDLGPDPDR